MDAPICLSSYNRMQEGRKSAKVLIDIGVIQGIPADIVDINFEAGRGIPD